MLYYNIDKPSRKVSLVEAVMRSASEERALYMPEKIPSLDSSFFEHFSEMTLQETAYRVTEPVFGEDIPAEELRNIIERALNFDIPLVKLFPDIYVLELFHGPTFAFKDVGARFLAGMLDYFAGSINNEIKVLVATSGDTGGAVANAFAGKKNIKVVILYPSGRVSFIQEQQLTKAGENILALEIKGDFDDCQKLVKQAFADSKLNEEIVLTSANSINFARLFPQSVYYFYSFAQLKKNDYPVVFSVPSGNFGNLTAGLIAKRMGLPAVKFIASTNINRSVPLYLESGKFVPHHSFPTISNAMDVGNPSNFRRILDLYSNDIEKIRADISGFWFTDEKTRQAMKELYTRYSYIADPHTAVAYLGLKEYMKNNSCTGIFLATAHP
ncbi:MAG TPA: threonine synthase, partial [Bacteroidales bacterium]|nr:threonine synthase [Bacteroidales bacterium]